MACAFSTSQCRLVHSPALISVRSAQKLTSAMPIRLTSILTHMVKSGPSGWLSFHSPEYWPEVLGALMGTAMS